MSSEIKGLSLRNYPIVLAELRGQEICDRMLRHLSPRLRNALSANEILASSWYPVGLKCDLHDAGHRATGEPMLAHMMGLEMTKRDLRGIYQLFMRAATPRHVLSFSARLFARYLRPGTMRVLETGPQFVRVQLDHCQGFNQHMWNDVVGGCQATLELAGASRVRIQIESGCSDASSGGTACATWNEGMSSGVSLPPAPPSVRPSGIPMTPSVRPSARPLTPSVRPSGQPAPSEE